MNDYQRISRIVNESINSVILEKMRYNTVRHIVSEAVDKIIAEGKNDNMKRNVVIKALKDPKYNHAQLAYKIWPDMDKDTARSLFAKMANGTPDNDGVIRQFSEKDVNALYQLIRKR